eukprot:TRINITY_DN31887_c0_g1_i1.p1 TRINITY_DN31887_c0_g1~~TRINITY_DN31887_c0_g1_i1.p1  ORF type:complete len:396 (+),score=28.60 TRINITY_DN31887_c0_g1_i1:82-1269(+)
MAARRFGWSTLASGERYIRIRPTGAAEDLLGPRRIFCFGDRLLRRPGLTAGEEALVAKMRDLSYWRDLCPELHVSTEPDPTLAPLIRPDEGDRATTLREGLVSEGYAVLPREANAVGSAGMPWSIDVHALGRCAARLEAEGWPPTFLLLYDEPWIMAHQISELLTAATDGNVQVMDWFIFRITPDGVPWSPHRDRPVISAQRTFKPNGMPKYNTVWIPLTDATLDNSCLMVLPLPADNNYFGEASSGDTTIPLTALQHVRPLVCGAGSMVTFSHRLLHWGSLPRTGHSEPARVAMSFACSDPEYESPCLGATHLPFPDPSVRLSLVAAQLLRYAHNVPASSQSWLNAIFEAFRENSSHFSVRFAEGINQVYSSALLSDLQRGNARPVSNIGMASF